MIRKLFLCKNKHYIAVVLVLVLLMFIFLLGHLHFFLAFFLHVYEELKMKVLLLQRHCEPSGLWRTFKIKHPTPVKEAKRHKIAHFLTPLLLTILGPEWSYSSLVMAKLGKSLLFAAMAAPRQIVNCLSNCCSFRGAAIDATCVIDVANRVNDDAASR